MSDEEMSEDELFWTVSQAHRRIALLKRAVDERETAIKDASDELEVTRGKLRAAQDELADIKARVGARIIAWAERA